MSVQIPDERCGTNRHTLFPIAFPGLFQFYLDGQASLWNPNEINFSNDIPDFESKLTENQREFLLQVLGFFSSSDSIVNENIFLNFFREIDIQEVKMFYSLQMYQETVHAHVYSLLIDTYVKDSVKKAFYLNAINTIESVKLKAEFANKYLNRESAPLNERLIAFAIVEGIFFSSSFACIFYFKSLGLMNSLCLSNNWIAADEMTHSLFACELYSTFTHTGYLHKVPKETIKQIFDEAMIAEISFCKEILKNDVVGINSDDMIKYTEYVANRLLSQLGMDAEYPTVKNPFDFMNGIGVNVKVNFFESRVADYSQSSEPPKFSTNDDF